MRLIQSERFVERRPSATTQHNLPAVWTSAQWVAYFKENARRRLEVPWESGPGISTDELDPIASSLCGWQLGETSDGRHLLAAAANYSARLDDPVFLDAVRLFILEEQRHGDHLGRFLDLAGVPRATRDWGDTLFRTCRYFMRRMEIWATPVVMVETHALIYYAAIRRATGSPVLRQICTQILLDEVPHVRFQCERLAILHRHRPRILRAATMVLHSMLFTGVTLAIWAGHRQALRSGGFSFQRFWQAAWRKMRKAWREMDPRAYRW